MLVGRTWRKSIGRGISAGVLTVLVVAAPVHGDGQAQAGDEQPAVSATLSPTKVSLVPGDVASVDLVVSNSSAQPVRVRAVSVRTPARLVAEDVPSLEELGTIDPGRLVRSTLKVRALPGLEEGDVSVLVEIETTHDGTTREQVAVATLGIASGKSGQTLDIVFLSFPPTLNDRQTATAVVQVSNPTPFEFENILVTVVDSEDVTLTPKPEQFARLQPGSTQVVKVGIDIDDHVRTGKQQVAVVVSGTMAGGSSPIASAKVVSADIDVTVFGVDAISPFGITALFVLPGLVALGTFLLGARAYPRTTAGIPDAVDFKDPKILVLVAPAAALVYLIVFKQWGSDLTNEVGTADVVKLFTVGMALGAAIWIIMAGIYYYRSDRKQFRPDDTAEKVLMRLAARKASVRLPSRAANDRSRCYLTEATDDRVVTCSVIHFRYVEGAEVDERQVFTNALTAGDPDEILKQVRRGSVTINFRLPSGIAILARDSGGLGPLQLLLVEG